MPRIKKGQYPENEKFAELIPRMRDINAFIDYLKERGIFLAEWFDKETAMTRMIQVTVQTDGLITGCFDIDDVKLEAERAAMLKMVQDQNDAMKESKEEIDAVSYSE